MIIVITLLITQEAFPQDLVYRYELIKPLHISLIGNEWEISLSNSEVLARNIISYGIYKEVIYAESDNIYYVFINSSAMNHYDLGELKFLDVDNVKLIEFDDPESWMKFLSETIGITSLQRLVPDIEVGKMPRQKVRAWDYFVFKGIGNISDTGYYILMILISDISVSIIASVKRSRKLLKLTIIFSLCIGYGIGKILAYGADQGMVMFSSITFIVCTSYLLSLLMYYVFVFSRITQKIIGR